MTGRLEAGLEEGKRALELDPMSSVINKMLALHFYNMKGFRSAIERSRRALELNPNDPEAPLILTHAFLNEPNHFDLVAETDLPFMLYPRTPPEVQQELRAVYRAEGARAVYQRALELRVARSQKECTDFPKLAAHILAYLGEADRMFACLLAAVDEAPLPTVHLFLYDPYRSDPRFHAIVKQYGLRDYFR